MEIQEPAPIPDNFNDVLCRFLRECTAEHDRRFANEKPPRDWCKAPSSNPNFPSQAAERGDAVDKCCKRKINDVKQRSKSPFSKSVQTDQPVNVLGGTCYPDVSVGIAPNCQGVWDFKTSCPPLPKGAPEPAWPVYGTGERFTRATRNTAWHGKSQKELYVKGCGTPLVTMIHENSEACN